ncbi:MAG: helix-hairpin-helix domain-containing protein, partial [Legionella sp.]|nr:helix-hairpin-helix domain-containing protein [Legionella sp.]
QVLSLQLSFKDANYGETYLASQFKDKSEAVIQQCWQKKCLPELEIDVLARLRNRSDDEVIYGIEKQLQGLLLTPKAPSGVVMGLYAENRTSLGVAVIAASGEVLDGCVLYPMTQNFRWHDAITTLAKYIAMHNVHLVSVGNGQNLHEIKRLLAGLTARYPDMSLAVTAVDEAGMLRDIRAFPGAISIARRFQDPLIELLQAPVEKIHFGEVQDEVNPKRLVLALTGVIEDTVNRIGVDINTAPVALLRYVSGFNLALAKTVVAYREAHGFFKTEEALKQVPGIDETHFLQAAGFLHFLDARLPWPDPRTAFKRPKFDARVKVLQDLKADMVLEGVVIRVVSFGAFIDVGIPQLGLLHISALAKRFLRDPHEVLHVGDVIAVHVLQVDIKKNQIALGMKSEEKSAALLEISKKKRKNKEVKPEKPARAPVLLNTAMADALAKLKRGTS